MNAVLSFPTHLAAPAHDLRVLAQQRDDPVGWAVLGACWSGLRREMAPDDLLRGLSRTDMHALAHRYGGPQAVAVLASAAGFRQPTPYDEFSDLLALLLAHRRDDSDPVRWLAHAIATASMYENHLWQDLHLPSRTVLSDLLAWGYPALAARNVGPMKWKKFFYKQLCNAAEFASCKSPTCGACADYPICFGSEDAPPLR